MMSFDIIKLACTVPVLPVNTNLFVFCLESFLTIPASIRQSLGLLLSAMGSSLILESLSTSGMVPGLLGASSDAQDSALRAAEDPGKGFFFSFIHFNHCGGYC